MEDFFRLQRDLAALLRAREPFRTGKELHEVLSGYNAMRDHINTERQLRGEISARELLADLDRFRTVTLDSQQYRLANQAAEYRRMLQYSVSPFPALPHDVFGGVAEMLHHYRQLDSAVASASFLTSIEVPDEQLQSEEELEGAVEQQLIEVVPAEALDALKQVRFAPFTLLTAAVQRPGVLREVSPRQFEELVAHLVGLLGIEDVQLTPERSDGGRDILGVKRILGIPILFAFECKQYSADNPVGVHVARALLGTITHGEYRADRGVLVTTSRFTKGAHDFILTSPQLEGVDFNGVVHWLHQASDQQRS